jgi:multiple sugar transport system permease protein
VTAAATAARSVRGRSRRPRTDEASFWIFVGPFVVGLLLFTLVPIAWAAVLSVFNSYGTVYPTEFVGLRNFTDILTNSEFLRSLGTFTIFAALIVPVTMAFALALALLMDRLPFAVGFFRSVFFLPVACSYVVASLIWKLGIFNGLNSSLANQVIVALGGEQVFNWLTQSPLYWILLVTVRLWLQVGFYMLLISAALQRIPDTLYEAAALDGVSRGWGRLRHITLPQLRSTLSAVLLLLLIAAFQAFDEFYNILGQGPTARPPLVYLFQTALRQQDFGHGSAGALVLTAVMVVVALAQNRFIGFGANDESRSRRRRAPRAAAAASTNQTGVPR